MGRRRRGRARGWRPSGRSAEAWLPSIVVAEVLNTICQRAGRAEARARFRSFERAGLEVVPLDPPLAHDAALLKCAHRNLPLADCIIAATALRLRGAVLSDDPHFSRIKGLRTAWI